MSAAISFSIERMDRLTKRVCVIVVRGQFLINGDLNFNFEPLHPTDATVSGGVRKILESRPRPTL